MDKLNRLIGTLALFIASAGIAQGAELFTPPLAPTSLAGDNFGECVSTNISDTTRDVLVQGFNSEGVVVINTAFTVEPNKTRGVSLTEAAPTGPVIFCKFSFKGSASNIRAAIHVLDGGGDGIISALEAR
ncbi:MAG TPA: hypothetical protein VJ325_02790 [Thiobacillus sp.]|nr:hypothetical protein [Thiobacillus sp.]